MILEQEIKPFSEWFPQTLAAYGEAAFFVILAAVIVGYLVSAFRYGPLPAGDRLYRTVVGAVLDLVHISPRRTWALTRLAIQEAMRRRVWTALVAFGIILVFAGWFLDPTSPAPGPLYLTFVMTWTTYLVVLLALFMSTFSLPADIKNRTITTVVTKPVRSSEIVLGRMLGFTLIGSALLAIMGFASYVFVVRALDHTHELRAEDLTALPLRAGETKPRMIGVVREGQHHEHDVELDASGQGYTDFKHGHRHFVTSEEVDGKTRYTVGPHEDMLVARVPLSGTLVFLDREGQPSQRGGQGRTASGGINVGKEWGYRGFVEGNTASAAIWTFDRVDEDALFPNTPPEDRKLPVEMTVRVFRTWKGNIEKGISGKLSLRNPETKLESEPIIFTAKEFAIESRSIDRELPRKGAAEGAPPIDVFRDLVHDGKLEIVLQCVESGQFLGAAQADLYIRAGDASFEANFIKGYLGIWFQMVLVIGMGVMFSTFLSGAVAMLVTLGSMLVGFSASSVGELFQSVITGDRKLVAGGGPVESFVRLITQKSITVPYDPGAAKDAMEWVDKVLMRMLKAWTDVLPDFAAFSNVNFVASGFNVPNDMLLAQATMTAGYLVAAFIAGLFFLRLREVAR